MKFLMSFYKSIFFIFLIITLYGGQLYGFNRNMTILLDWDNEVLLRELSFNEYSAQKSSFGATFNTFITALLQQASIVIASSVTLQNFIMRRFIFQDAQSNMYDEQFLDKYKRFNRFNTIEKVKQFRQIADLFILGKWFNAADFNANQIDEMSNYYLCSIINLDRWEIKKLNQFYYGLVPKNYLAEVKKQIPGVSDSQVLGIRWDNYYSVNIMEKMWQEPLNLLSNMGDSFNDVFAAMFVKPEDLVDSQGKKYIFDWFFYVQGHGGNGRVAALTHDQFKRFLQTCNDTIYTKFLFYETCYAGGQHLQEPFEYQSVYPPLKPGMGARIATRQESYNFYIATGTLSYSTTATYLIRFNLPLMLPPQPLEYDINFGDYFKKLGDYFGDHLSKITWFDIVQTVHNSEIAGRGYQIPIVRFPHTEWFTPAQASKDVERLTRTMAEVAEVEDKIIILKNKKIIILNAQRPGKRRKEEITSLHAEILAPIEIHGTEQTAFIASDPLPVSYYFEEFGAPRLYITNLLKMFIPSKGNKLTREFFMGKVTIKNNLDPDVWKKAGIDSVPQKDELIELENVYIGNYVLGPLGLKTGRQNLFLFTFSGKNLGIIFDELDEKKLQGIINGHWDLQIIKPKLYPQAFINAHKESIQTLAELKKVIEQKIKKGISGVPVPSAPPSSVPVPQKVKPPLPQRPVRPPSTVQKPVRPQPSTQQSQPVNLIAQNLDKLTQALTNLSKRIP